MVGIIEADCDKLACYNNVSLTYAGFAARWKLLKQTATSLSAIIIPLLHIGFAVKSNLLEHAGTC